MMSGRRGSQRMLLGPWYRYGLHPVDAVRRSEELLAELVGQRVPDILYQRGAKFVMGNGLGCCQRIFLVSAGARNGIPLGWGVGKCVQARPPSGVRNKTQRSRAPAATLPAATINGMHYEPAADTTSNPIWPPIRQVPGIR